MASLSSPTDSPAAIAAENEPVTSSGVLIAGFGAGVAVDYAAYRQSRERKRPAAPEETVAYASGSDSETVAYASGSDSETVAYASGSDCRSQSIVIFLQELERHRLDAVLQLAIEQRTEFVGIVSTFRVHLGDDAALKGRSLRAAAINECGYPRRRVPPGQCAERPTPRRRPISAASDSLLR